MNNIYENIDYSKNVLNIEYSSLWGRIIWRFFSCNPNVWYRINSNLKILNIDFHWDQLKCQIGISFHYYRWWAILGKKMKSSTGASASRRWIFNLSQVHKLWFTRESFSSPPSFTCSPCSAPFLKYSQLVTSALGFSNQIKKERVTWETDRIPLRGLAVASCWKGEQLEKTSIVN